MLKGLIQTVSYSLILVCSVCAVPIAQAHPLHESDLSGTAPGIPKELPALELSADRVRLEPSSERTEVQVLRWVKGQPTPVEGLSFSPDGSSGVATTNAAGIAEIPGCTIPGRSVSIAANLENGTFFEIAQSRGMYRLLASVVCGSRTVLEVDPASATGQALGIWQVATRAQTKLGSTVGLDFWKSKIRFLWPSDGDYYSWNAVNLTRGEAWDVVGHEMGHAIYDQAKIGDFGGGPHKIDECYSAEMALSEGWASYFSAWVSVDLADPDARFEYLVPRRAPIRFENVPADVCKGPTNEWRVTSFFWDLIDLHDDGETMQESFARVWQALAGSRSPSVSSAKRSLVMAGLDPALLSLIWQLNFQSPEPQESLREMRRETPAAP